MLSIVVAMGRNRAIGKDNQLLWHLPEDLKNFKRLTMGGTMIMGRKTFESIGKALPGRTTLVVTRDHERVFAGAHNCPSLEAAMTKAREMNNSEEIFIVGGGEIYRQALPLVDRIYLSLVDLAPEADTFFAEFSGFKRESVQKFPAHSHYPAWEFQVWEREA